MQLESETITLSAEEYDQLVGEAKQATEHEGLLAGVAEQDEAKRRELLAGLMRQGTGAPAPVRRKRKLTLEERAARARRVKARKASAAARRRNRSKAWKKRR